MVASRSSTLENPGSSTDTPSTNYLSAHVHQTLMPETARPAVARPETPSHITFNTSDIYHASAATSTAEHKILSTSSASKIKFTTPGEDHKAGTQPDYYMNSKGQITANPKAHPSKDGSVSIEVEGNNAATKVQQYADKMQRDSIKDLVSKYQQAHPGQPIPEMWASILNAATPNSNFPNSGDGANNNTVTPAEQSAYDNSQAYNPTPPPVSSAPESDTYTPSSSNTDSGSGGAVGGDSNGSGGGGGGTGGSDATSSIPSGSTGTGDGGASTANLTQSSGPSTYDGSAADMSQTQNSIMTEANADVGKAMWGGFSGATGVEGCAASVSQVLDNAKVANLHNAQDDNVNGMQADLQQQGWTVTSTPQPGDVWIGRGGASSGHTGIVGENNTLLNNNSSDGKFSSDPLSMTGQWTTSVYLKPPAAKG